MKQHRRGLWPRLPLIVGETISYVVCPSDGSSKLIVPDSKAANNVSERIVCRNKAAEVSAPDQEPSQSGAGERA